MKLFVTNSSPASSHLHPSCPNTPLRVTNSNTVDLRSSLNVRITIQTKQYLIRTTHILTFSNHSISRPHVADEQDDLEFTAVSSTCKQSRPSCGVDFHFDGSVRAQRLNGGGGGGWGGKRCETLQQKFYLLVNTVRSCVVADVETQELLLPSS